MLAILRKLTLGVYHSPAIRQSAVLTIGTVSSGLIMAVAFIFVSRSLGPEQFGVFSVSLALMGLLMRIPDLGLSQVMLKMLGNWYGQDSKIRTFLSVMLYWKLWLSAGLIVFGIFCIPLLQISLRFPYPSILLVTILGSALIGAYEYVSVVLAARHEFLWVSVLSFLQSVLKAVGFFLLLLFGVGQVLPLAAVYYLAPFLAASIVGWHFRANMLFHPQRGTPELKLEIKSFAKHAALGTLFMTIISNVDVLMVQRALNPFETGIYSGAGKVAVFVAFLAGAISGVLNNRVSRYTERPVLLRYLQKSTIVILASVVGFILFVPFARLAIILTIGPEYVSGLAALIVLVLNAFMSLALVPYIAFFYAVNRPSYFSIAGLLQVAIIVGGNLLFLDTAGIMAAAWSRVAATTVLALYTAWAIWREMSPASKRVKE